MVFKFSFRLGEIKFNLKDGSRECLVVLWEGINEGIRDLGNELLTDLRKSYDLIQRRYFNNEILLPTVVM